MEEVVPVSCILFVQIKAEGLLPNLFCVASINLIQKLNKDITRKEIYRLVSLMNIGAEFLKKILANQIQKQKLLHNTTKWDLFQVYKAELTVENQLMSSNISLTIMIFLMEKILEGCIIKCIFEPVVILFLVLLIKA